MSANTKLSQDTLSSGDSPPPFLQRPLVKEKGFVFVPSIVICNFIHFLCVPVLYCSVLNIKIVFMRAYRIILNFRPKEILSDLERNNIFDVKPLFYVKILKIVNDSSETLCSVSSWSIQCLWEWPLSTLDSWLENFVAKGCCDLRRISQPFCIPEDHPSTEILYLISIWSISLIRCNQ